MTKKHFRDMIVQVNKPVYGQTFGSCGVYQFNLQDSAR